MGKQDKRPPDDASSAPESGTVRNETSGNQPSDRTQGEQDRKRERAEKDDPSHAGEEP